MSLRTELPWEDIEKDVIAAIDGCNEKKRFISVKVVAYYAIANYGKFTALMQRTGIYKKKVTMSRVTMALRKLGWTQYAGVGRRGRTFIDPRY